MPHMEPALAEGVSHVRDALQAGTYRAGHRILDGLPLRYRSEPEFVLARFKVCEAQGSYKRVDKELDDLLGKDAEHFVSRGGEFMVDLLKVIHARLDMYMRCKFTPYASVALSVWERRLSSLDVEAYDENMVLLELECHRGLHMYSRGVYNEEDASLRVRPSSLEAGKFPAYPLPLEPPAAVERLETLTRHLICNNRLEEAFKVLMCRLICYQPPLSEPEDLLEEIEKHFFSGHLLRARVRLFKGTQHIRPQTFTIADGLLKDAQEVFEWLDYKSGLAELRAAKNQMAAIAFRAMGVLNNGLFSGMVEAEYIDAAKALCDVECYLAATHALSSYFDFAGTLQNPTMLEQGFQMLEKTAKEGEIESYVWIQRAACLSRDVRAGIGLGEQGVWCETFFQRHKDSGAYAMLERYAVCFGRFYYEIGNYPKQVEYATSALEFKQLRTVDIASLAQSADGVFIDMFYSLNHLSGKALVDLALKARVFCLQWLQKSTDAGLTEWVEKYKQNISRLDQSVGHSHAQVSFRRNPLKTDKPLEVEQLTEIYLSEKEKMHSCLATKDVDGAFEVFRQIREILKTYQEGGTDFAYADKRSTVVMIECALLLQLSQALAAGWRTTSHLQRALECAEEAAQGYKEIGELRSQVVSLTHAATVIILLKPIDWHNRAVGLLHEAEVCGDLLREETAARSLIDALENKQQVVASLASVDLYRMGYIALQASGTYAEEDPVAKEEGARKTWEWIQRGKARSISDLLSLHQIYPERYMKDVPDEYLGLAREKKARIRRLGQQPQKRQPPLEKMVKEMNESPELPRFKPMQDVNVNIRLEDILSCQEAFAQEHVGRHIVFVDWMISSNSIDMIIVTETGTIRIDVLDFTAEFALKYIKKEPCRLRSSEDVMKWKGKYFDSFSSWSEDSLETEYLEELNWLVAPLAKVSKPNDLLVFCPSGVLHGIPLHALSIGDQCLIERNPIIYCDSLSMMLNSYRKAKEQSQMESNPSTAAVFGVYGRSGMTQGSKSREETEVQKTLESLAAQLDTEVSFNASATDFIDRCAGRSIIHYHGHAILNKKEASGFKQALLLQPQQTKEGDKPISQLQAQIKAETTATTPTTSILNDGLLLLSPSSSSSSSATSANFTAREMFTSLRLRSAHVTLIACSSAGQEISFGEEPQGIIPALLLAGAASVVGTLWPIKSQDGRLFTQEFYRHFGEPGSVVDLALALQESVLTIRKERPAPIHWAPFVLHGAWSHRV